MQMPLSSAAQDLGLMPDPAGEMDLLKKRRQKEKGSAADDDPASMGDNAFSAAVMDLFGGSR